LGFFFDGGFGEDGLAATSSTGTVIDDASKLATGTNWTSTETDTAGRSKVVSGIDGTSKKSSLSPVAIRKRRIVKSNQDGHAN
jgi:hypothetical protein